VPVSVSVCMFVSRAAHQSASVKSVWQAVRQRLNSTTSRNVCRSVYLRVSESVSQSVCLTVCHIAEVSQSVSLSGQNVEWDYNPRNEKQEELEPS
jgi:hypothetical protein